MVFCLIASRESGVRDLTESAARPGEGGEVSNGSQAVAVAAGQHEPPMKGPSSAGHGQRPRALALQAGDMGAYPQQVAPGQEAGELAGGAVDDRYAADIG